MSRHDKQRCDSWAAPLTQEQQWKIYTLMRRHPWQQVCEYIAAEHAIESPSRSRLYSWRKRLAKLESSHRIEQAILARDAVDDLASKARMTDAHLISSYKTLAAELAVNGDASAARTYTEMALALAAQQTKARELELKSAAQQTKDEQLRLAREKFEAAEARLRVIKDEIGKARTGGITPETLRKIEEAAGLL